MNNNIHRDNANNAITEKLGSLAREVSSSESLAWRPNQLCRNLGHPRHAHCSPFLHRFWHGHRREYKGGRSYHQSAVNVYSCDIYHPMWLNHR